MRRPQPNPEPRRKTAPLRRYGATGNSLELQYVLPLYPLGSVLREYDFCPTFQRVVRPLLGPRLPATLPVRARLPNPRPLSGLTRGRLERDLDPMLTRVRLPTG